MSPTGDLHVTLIFLWGGARLSLLRDPHMLHWHGTKPEHLTPRLNIQNALLGLREPLKNSGSHIDASHSRQPLVKGERLVRYEVNAVMLSLEDSLGVFKLF